MAKSSSAACGVTSNSKPAPETSAPAFQALAFSGIHVVSPRIFPKLIEDGAFSIVDAYLRLAAAGESILGFRSDGAYWRDLGRPEQLAEAEQDLKDGTYPAS